MTYSGFHFWRRHWHFKEMLQKADYFLSTPFPSEIAANTNLTSKAPGLTSNETFLRSKNGASERRSLLLLEQTAAKLMQSMLQKCTKPGEIVFSPFFGTETTAKAWLHETGNENLLPASWIVTAFSRWSSLSLKSLPLKYWIWTRIQGEQKCLSRIKQCFALTVFYGLEAERRVEIELWPASFSKVLSPSHSIFVKPFLWRRAVTES